jgi:peptide/nickel transport system ATP-binding protein/oligopeptide transport system ATP-binding protein
VVHAACGVSFDLLPGQTLGLVGESGSGKTTVARSVLHLQRPTAGSVRFRGREIGALSPGELRQLRRDLQIVFQDPYASLDPRMTAEQIVAEPLQIHRGHDWNGRSGRQRVAELLDLVGLDPASAGRHPAEFSGGQRQRIGIARALALDPSLVVLDEPVSALDVSIQAGIINLLADLQRRLGMAYLFVAHDLAVIRHLATDVAVMYLGEIVETAPRDALFAHPVHPYTQALLSATPVPDPAVERRRERILLSGEPADPTAPPTGCRFHTRCWRYAGELDERSRERCRSEAPELVDRGHGHASRCHFATERAEQGANGGWLPGGERRMGA